MYREVTGSNHSDGSGNLPVHSSVPGGYRCFSFAVIDPVESQHFPLILKHYNELGLEMHHFQTMPMHLYFLGEKLISKTELIVKRNNKQQNEF